MGEYINKSELLKLISSIKTEINPATTSEEVGQLVALNKIVDYINTVTIYDYEPRSSDINELICILQLIEIRFNVSVAMGGFNRLTYLSTIYGIKEVHKACEIAFDKYKDAIEFFDKIGGILYNRRKSKQRHPIETPSIE